MHKLKKLQLLSIIFLINFTFINIVRASGSGFAFNDFWLLMANVSNWVFLISIYAAALSIIAGILGAITGKFKIKIYLPFIFLLIAIIFFIAPLFFPSTF